MITTLRKHSPDGYRDALGEDQVFDAYRVFDMPVRSQIALPELPRLSNNCAGAPAVVVKLVAAGSINPEAFAACHEWRTEQGLLLCRCSRRDADYLLSFPQQADFHIETGGIINCLPAPGVGQGLVRHLLLNQVLPRYFAHTGELLLHASAVTLANGNTVAFLGHSGYGKSTLASYCHLHGAQMIDDDCVLLRHGARETCITGGVPTLRLYPDSLRALGHNPARFAPYAVSTQKLQMSLNVHPAPATSPRVLHALFLLDRPGKEAVDGAVRFAPVGGQAAMMSVLNSAFTLHPSDRNTLSGRFQCVAQALAAGLPVQYLQYPRKHTALPSVLQALLSWRVPERAAPGQPG